MALFAGTHQFDDWLRYEYLNPKNCRVESWTNVCEIFTKLLAISEENWEAVIKQ